MRIITLGESILLGCIDIRTLTDYALTLEISFHNKIKAVPGAIKIENLDAGLQLSLCDEIELLKLVRGFKFILH